MRILSINGTLVIPNQYKPTMLPRLTYLLCAFALVLTSCSKQDTAGDLSNIYDTSYLHGTYRLSVLEVNKPSNVNGKGTNDTYNLVDEMSCYQPNIELQEQGTVAFRGTELVTGTDDRKGLFTFKCGEEKETFGQWKFRNHQIILGTAEFRIEGNQLIYKAKSDKEMYSRIIYTRI